MNNKGFAITGIIYTLFILFLIILLTVLSGLSTFQKLMINSTETLESSFLAKKIDTNELEEIKQSGIAKYRGKYIFEFTQEENEELKFECSTYLDKGADLKNENIIFSPKDCNDYDINMVLVGVYSFEKES